MKCHLACVSGVPFLPPNEGSVCGGSTLGLPLLTRGIIPYRYGKNLRAHLRNFFPFFFAGKECRDFSCRSPWAKEKHVKVAQFPVKAEYS